MPVYNVDWTDYNKHKAQGERCKDYKIDKYETITIHWAGSDTSGKSAIKQIKQDHLKIVISTGQYFAEDIVISNLECPLIVYPFVYEDKLIQYIDRIQ